MPVWESAREAAPSMLLTTDSSVILRLGDVSSSVSADVASGSPSSPSLIPSAMLAVCPEPSTLCKQISHTNQCLTVHRNSASDVRHCILRGTGHLRNIMVLLRSMLMSQ